MTTPSDAGPQWPYQRIAAEIRARIADGTIAGQLPSHAALAEQYDVATHTVVRALETLKAEGLIEAKAGLGTFTASR